MADPGDPQFNANEIRVFDRAGNPLGSLTKWTITQPRNYKLNEIEEFGINIPRRDEDGWIITTAVANLLKADNLVYVANQLQDMRGWAGAISEVAYVNDVAEVKILGMASLFLDLETALIEQTEGLVATAASRLVAAAQSKQSAHGDLVIEFIQDGTRDLHGKFSYEGDVLAGLQQLAQSTTSDFYVHSRINPSGNLVAALHWGARYVIDHTDVTFFDGPSGNLLPGTRVDLSSLDIANRVRLRGQSTHVADFIHYDSLRSIIKEVTPEVEVILDDPSSANLRRRENLSMTVGWGYSEAEQEAQATIIENRYIGYYKKFLAAYHNMRGRPFLDGYEWGGDNGNRYLGLRYFRSWQKLGYIGTRSVIYGDSANDSVDAAINDFVFQSTVSVGGDAVGMAINTADLGTYLIASTDGNIYVLDEDRTTKTLWQGVTGGGETLVGVATDQNNQGSMYVALTGGGNTYIREYDYSSKALLSQFTISGVTLNDISVNSSEGELYGVATDGVGNVQVRDISNGVLISGRSFPSGHTNPTGLSTSGGIAYVLNAAGQIRMLFVEDGNFAASFSSAVPANGAFVDSSSGEIWMIKSDGDIALYSAHIAVATIPDAGSAQGAPGFEEIVAGQFVHIVARGSQALVPTNKLRIVYAQGRYVTEVISSEIGEPDRFQRTWVTGDQKEATSDTTVVTYSHNDIVVQGEESRVNDWDPKTHGTGEFREQWFKTKGGKLMLGAEDWWPKEWNVSNNEFAIDLGAWTSGEAFLNEWLSKNNKERTNQTVRLVNRDNVWTRVVLGGLYTVTLTLQGPETGLTGTMRVLAYEPDEMNGIMTVTGEWV